MSIIIEHYPHSGEGPLVVLRGCKGLGIVVMRETEYDEMAKAIEDDRKTNKQVLS